MELNKLKRLASFALSAAVAVSFMPSVAFADVTASGSSQTFNDMPNNWATASLNSAVENGLLKGYKVADGMEIRPNGNITRAEFVTVVNRAFGATEKAALTGVTDVKSEIWYADEIAKAIGMHTLSKAEKVRPDDSITRQEAFTILARAYRQTGGTRNSFAKFTDSASVADFAVDGVGALIENGYVNGADGKLNPLGHLTRAEFAKIMDNLTAAYVNTTETYSKDVTGNVIVNTPGAKLKDMKINGNLIIAEGVGEGDVDINDVQIGGDIIVKAGGENSIHIANVTVGGTLVVNKVGGTVRIVASGTTNVKMVEVGSDVIITATDLKGGEIGTVKIDGSDVSDVVLRGDFKTVETAVKDVKITANEGKIGEFVMTEKATVTGASTITTVKNETNEAVSVNGKTVEAGKSTSSGTTDTPAATGGSTGGGGGASGGGGTGGGSGSGGGSGTGGGTTQPTTKYTITVSDTTNGTVTAAKTSNIEAGESVIITITPDANYQLNTITVNGVDKTSSVVDGKLTVTVNENLTVAATFESTSSGGGGSQPSRVNPAPDPEANGGAVAFAEGYPVIDLENHKVKIRMAAATASEVFGIVVNMNSQCDQPTVHDIIHGHSNNLVYADDRLYLAVNDTEEHELSYKQEALGSGKKLIAAFAVKTGENISAQPIKAEASVPAVQEADTIAPVARGAYVNKNKDKIILYLTEKVTVSGDAPNGFSIGEATITNVTYSEESGYHKLELAVSGELGDTPKISYSGESIKDEANNVMAGFTNRTILAASMEATTKFASADLKFIHLVLDAEFFFPDTVGEEGFTVKYGTTADSATAVTVSDVDYTGGSATAYYITVDNPPTPVDGGKYFVEIAANGKRTVAFDTLTENISIEVEKTQATAVSIIPTVVYDSSLKQLTVTFPDNALISFVETESVYQGPNCRFFITDNNGKIYKMRGVYSFTSYNTNTLTFADDYMHEFPFDPTTFDWEGAKLSYSNMIHPDEGIKEELVRIDGTVVEEFLNVPITVR